MLSCRLQQKQTCRTTRACTQLRAYAFPGLCRDAKVTQKPWGHVFQNQCEQLGVRAKK